MVIKLNSMIREEAHDENFPIIVLNLQDKTEPEITKILGRKVIHWFPIQNIALWEVLAYISQLTNCDYRAKGHYVVITPSLIYNEDMSDVDRMMHPGRNGGGH